jgi:hypothetical protein
MKVYHKGREVIIGRISRGCVVYFKYVDEPGRWVFPLIENEKNVDEFLIMW